ncbi:MAG TPA: SDR family NAD(P)-dependent oxidoreductase [Hyphomonadaceae bacterium]|jgi:NAD(P)-dependent dehydrogenase (short-subunit alcohol dehydrogenase family)|nr:SDR family NAD(P)-dependent oxidoreductase [Hyphomonadaceae bacterium]
MAGRLHGRRAIVTGAASGIGKASAALFAAEGARVLAVDQLERQLEAPVGGAALEIDITSQDAPERIVGEAVGAFGGLDILFNNAGVSGRAKVEEMTDEFWDRVQAVNVRAPFRIARAAISALKGSPAGRIINTASVMAEVTDVGLAAYCASKAGVAGLTRTLALELGKFSITANYLLPGAIRTGMTSALWDERPEIAEIWAKKAVLRRLGEPEDLARVALFLASDDAGFVTGQGLAADGGLTLRC